MKKYILALSFMFLLLSCKGNISNNLPQVDDEKDDNRLELLFNNKMISCNKGLSSGDMIEDGIELTFTFIGKLKEGQNIKVWKANGEVIKATEKAKKITIKIDAKKAKKQKDKKTILIEVDLEEKEDEPTFEVQFDESKINANGILGNTKITEGYKAKEGEQIKFSLKDASIKVESWMINGNKASEEASFLYTVKKEDANSEGSILVDYVEKLDVYTLTFSEEKIKAEKLPNNEAITSSYQAKVGEAYKFSLKDENEKVEYWSLNGNKIAESAKTELTYTVKKGDANKDLNIEIAYKALDEKKLVITFGEDIEKCVISGFLSDTEIKSGDSVKIGLELKLTAKLLQGEKVEKWIIGGKEELKQEKVLRYKTKLEDAKDGVINIRVEKKAIEGATIKYDESLMDCLNYQNNKERIEPNSKVFQGMKLKFTAKLKAGFELVNWTVNATPKPDERRDVFIYTVDVQDGKGENKEIEISYTLKENETYKIAFDEAKITCNEFQNKEKKIKSGDIVSEGTWLDFKALLGEYDEVERWIVKGEERTFASTYTYTVDKRDVEMLNGEKVINVGVRLKQKCKFQFDDALISCKYAKDHKIIDKEVGVTVGWKLVISAKLKEGERVAKWKVNDVVQKSWGKIITDDVFRYTVNARDVNSEGYIKIDVEIEKLKAIKLKFDVQNITCTKGNVPVENGANVYEGEKLKFTTMMNAEEVEDWLVKGERQGWKGYAHFDYTVKMKDAETIEDVPTLTVALEVKERMRVVFESTDMTCKFYYSHQGGAIFPNDIILPQRWIQFNAIVPEGKKVKEWQVNGKKVVGSLIGDKRLSADRKKFDYFPRIDDAVLASDGRREIKITIEFE